MLSQRELEKRKKKIARLLSNGRIGEQGVARGRSPFQGFSGGDPRRPKGGRKEGAKDGMKRGREWLGEGLWGSRGSEEWGEIQAMQRLFIMSREREEGELG